MIPNFIYRQGFKLQHSTLIKVPRTHLYIHPLTNTYDPITTNNKPQNLNMSSKDITQANITNGDQLKDEQWVIDSIMNGNAALTLPSAARIHRVSGIEKGDYEKYYVPKVVSIGPHHFGNEKLELVEKLKPVFTMKLLSNKEALKSLYKKLGDPKMVQELRSFYDKASTTQYSNKEFTKMMLQDSCFILYYIRYIFGGKPEDYGGLNRHQVVFLHQDLFLLENQVPFKALLEGMKELVQYDWLNKINMFMHENILSSTKTKRKWLKSMFCIQNDKICHGEKKLELAGDNEPIHLIHLLHRTLTHNINVPTNENNYRCTFRNVNELMDVGIHFKPSNTTCLAHVKFINSWWWFRASVELPPITVDDSTKPMLLNLIAYEMCTSDTWVTSYVCLLDSLIDHPEDVKALRKVGVLENSLGSDKEVAELFNKIGTDLVPNNLAYFEAKYKIQRHYESQRNTVMSQLKHEYVKSPWAFLALLGGMMALFLSAVQAFFSVWSPKTECDILCETLNNKHHL
ncbi:UPF0481 protein At3g47200-like [Bidens hawaiensis]|uniref:UPF0481 protein At3g47200-like n=1 Tax=Bidens hawaiensis TaxID=980011 RepID=UPI0040491F27